MAKNYKGARDLTKWPGPHGPISEHIMNHAYGAKNCTTPAVDKNEAIRKLMGAIGHIRLIIEGAEEYEPHETAGVINAALAYGIAALSDE